MLILKPFLGKVWVAVIFDILCIKVHAILHMKNFPSINPPYGIIILVP